MPNPDESQDMLEKADDTVERIIQHLLRWPCDLTDARRLMRSFQASAADFQQALARLEEAVVQPSSTMVFASV